MTNKEIIRKKFKAFLDGVHNAGNRALCEQMESTLNMSLNLHEQLESGYHAHHLTESDSHGWAVADDGALVDSGASLLSEPNEHGSAEAKAARISMANAAVQSGVFTSVLANPFEGGGSHDVEDGGRISTNPHDSMRFEGKVLELLEVNARANFPYQFRKNFKVATQK